MIRVYARTLDTHVPHVYTPVHTDTGWQASGFSPCSFRRCYSLPGKMALRAGAAKRNDRASKIKAANRFINFPFKRSQINFLPAFGFVRPSIKSHFPGLASVLQPSGAVSINFSRRRSARRPSIHDFSSFVSRVSRGQRRNVLSDWEIK
mgnify:CR=1 FL=1